MVGVERILQLLAYLAAVVGVLPVVSFLSWWVQLVLLFALLLGIIGDRRGHYLLGNRTATVLSVGFFLQFLLQVSWQNLVEPLIQMLCLYMAVRLASDKSARHLLQLFSLATIILASSSMLTLDMAYLVYLILMVLLVTSGLVLLSFYATDPQLRFARCQWLLLVKVIALLPVGSLVLMLILFVILPRTQTPLWNFLNPKSSATVGMNDQVEPGSVAELAQSGKIAFRAEVEQLPANVLYWRGVVLNRLEGQVWKRSGVLATEKLFADQASETRVTIYSEPKADRYLVTLDHPRLVDGIRHRRAADGVISGRWSADRKVSYQVWAQYAARSRQTGSAAVYLQLPNELSQRLLTVGRQIAAGQNYQEKIDLLERFFFQQQLSYSTRQLPTTENPVETFLFESKRGYCEYFASSFAILLRLGGVPARLVGGYLGGEYNQLAGYYLVGEDAAHVWVEALDDKGIWQRLDPSRLAINAEQALWSPRQQGLASFQALADALLHNWNRLVVNYDLRQQFGLVREVAGQFRELRQFDRRSWIKIIWSLPIVVFMLLLYFRRQKKHRAERLLMRYRKQVAKRAGLKTLSPVVGLYELARQSGEPLCFEFASVYGGAIYRDRQLSDIDYRRLKKIVSDLATEQSAIEVALPGALGDNDKS